ncbi:hypothetical protein [Isobaculum melis]|uniref:Uncharacterized protein n=1 Tax=Isobaculum melis TaxID=142588 RepID=A0A1H9PR74_9LACT|nr:hypothetical protein [Isobaculum melis]SER50590.1 hypothetical protein SAMN04488559_10179 [Isobaculum melis]
MKIYIKLNKTDNMNLGYRNLAEKMWFGIFNGKKLELSHGGNNETLCENFSLSLKWDKWLNDERWSQKKFDTEYIMLDPIRNKTILYFKTDHINILTVDKRALYTMVIEISKEVEGLISEDNMETWITVEEFINKHQEVLNLTFDEANNISLNESEILEEIEEPWNNEVEYI